MKAREAKAIMIWIEQTLGTWYQSFGRSTDPDTVSLYRCSIQQAVAQGCHELISSRHLSVPA